MARRRFPKPPPFRPKPMKDLDVTFEMLKVEAEINALKWGMQAREQLPPGWGDVERKNPVRPPKVKMTLRLDEDVAIFFRWQGEGYQARINAVLRLFMLSRLGIKPDEG
jgi:uncharacterized protein (DUF4415 family)